MTISEEKINEVGTNIQEKASLIWNVADSLRGPFKPHEYGLVIIPMTVIKRFHDCLLPTHDAVLKKYEQVKHLEVRDGFLRTASGYQFYNISPFTFSTLLADQKNIEDNFKAYIAGFSDNVQDILAKFDFDNILKRMVESGTLYVTISEFNTEKAYMGPDKISAVDMGYIFENLINRFSESYDEEAGAHFTSRDIVYLMSDLLVEGDKDAFSKQGSAKTVYDMAMGTSQMLTCMEERIHQMDSEAEVTCFGQEINPQTFGIAKADMLIRGGDPNNMQYGDTLLIKDFDKSGKVPGDQFDGYQFSYIISNPPFGIDWKKEAESIEAENAKGDAGRFAPGLPPKSDGQLLFMLNGIKKLRNDGRMAIIQNGSSLFTGDAGSGPSEIRRYIIENDLLDAIIQLPNDAFYNTGISTYIWIIEKNKPEERVGKVQLIDASNCYEKRRKSIGSKRVDITDACRALILSAYGDFQGKTYTGKTESDADITVESKIFDDSEFGYSKVIVCSPVLNKDGEPEMKKGKPVEDTEKRDTESIPLNDDMDAYMVKEVLPYNPGAWIDNGKTKVGYEIPFTRYFYKCKPIESFDSIMERIEERQKRLLENLEKFNAKDGE